MSRHPELTERERAALEAYFANPSGPYNYPDSRWVTSPGMDMRSAYTLAWRYGLCGQPGPMPVRELAVKTGLTTSAVYWRLKHARAKLRRLAKPSEPYQPAGDH